MTPSFPQQVPNPAMHPNASSCTSAYSHQDSPTKPQYVTRQPTQPMSESGQVTIDTGLTGEYIFQFAMITNETEYFLNNELYNII